MNETRRNFLNLCEFNSLIFGGSIFAHKRIQKANWISPDNITENQIDHICISKEFRRSLQDVQKRAEGVGIDHYLLNTRLKPKINRTDKQSAGRF
jgi:hypothetical protein